MDVLRIATAGSVDDGKSTLIGRLLHDAKVVCEDQWAGVEATSRRRGDEQVDLALLTDGLRAEREQGITIDVAYRYATTPRRSFIIADTPGHRQYTRNMVTGASTADLALLLVDARKGVVEQTRRHATLAALLRVPHVLLCVNKMDLVGWSRDTYDAVRAEFESFAARLELTDVTVLPMAALPGDNVVHRSPELGWYEGAPLLSVLEELYVASDRNLIDLRLPVQYVLRPHRHDQPDYRAYAGRLASGVLRPGDEVLHLPSGLTTRVASIDTPTGPLDQAAAPHSVSVRLEDELDVGRGDLLCRPDNRPHVTQDLDLMVCWFAEGRSLRAGDRVLVKHTTQTVPALVDELRYRLDVHELHREEAVGSLELNDIGRVRLRTARPLFVDEYRRNRTTGAVVLIDEATNRTVGAGMVQQVG